MKINLGEIGWDDMERIGVAHDKDQWVALVNAVVNLRVPENVLEWPHNWWLLSSKELVA
jgi:hypothetical protein